MTQMEKGGNLLEDSATPCPCFIRFQRRASSINDAAWKARDDKGLEERGYGDHVC